jgi:hypothetical protein
MSNESGHTVYPWTGHCSSALRSHHLCASWRARLQLGGPPLPKPFRPKPIITIGQATSPCTDPGRECEPMLEVDSDRDGSIGGRTVAHNQRPKERKKNSLVERTYTYMKEGARGFL